LSAPTAGLAAVCLPDEVWECLQSQEATDRAWIGLGQNFVDTAVNEWRKHLHACVHIVGQRFKQFYCRQLKNVQLNEMSAKVLKKLTKYVFVCYLDLAVTLGNKNISVVLISPGSAHADFGRGGKFNVCVMASCLANIRTKNY